MSMLFKMSDLLCSFIIFAADLQDPPELILEMVDEWMEGNKYIICERISRNDPWTSKIFSLIYYKLLRLLVIKDYPKGGYNVALLDKALKGDIKMEYKEIKFTYVRGK